jgi:hypothetical protein
VDGVKVFCSAFFCGLLALKSAHTLCVVKNVSFHRMFYVAVACARVERQLAAQGVEFEDVSVRLARRRTRAVIACLAEVVAALARSIRELIFFFGALRKWNARRLQVIGIVRDQSQ